MELLKMTVYLQLDLQKINNGKYRYIAGGNNDSNGYLFEYNIENDSFLGSRLISLESTSKSIDKKYSL